MPVPASFQVCWSSPDRRQATFIAIAGVLPADSYTATLTSARLRFGTFSGTFSMAKLDGPRAATTWPSSSLLRRPGAVTVSLPNFARGYGQLVQLLADNPTAGIPLLVSDGFGLSSLDMQLHYDPCCWRLRTLSSTLPRRPAKRGGGIVLAIARHRHPYGRHDKAGSTAGQLVQFLCGDRSRHRPLRGEARWTLPICTYSATPPVCPKYLPSTTMASTLRPSSATPAAAAVTTRLTQR